MKKQQFQTKAKALKFENETVDRLPLVSRATTDTPNSGQLNTYQHGSAMN